VKNATATKKEITRPGRDKKMWRRCFIDCGKKVKGGEGIDIQTYRPSAVGETETVWPDQAKKARLSIYSNWKGDRSESGKTLPKMP